MRAIQGMRNHSRLKRLAVAIALGSGAVLMIGPADAGRIKKGGVVRTASNVCTTATANVVFVAPASEVILRVINPGHLTAVRVSLDDNSSALPDSGFGGDSLVGCASFGVGSNRRLRPGGDSAFENVEACEQLIFPLISLMPGSEYLLTIYGDTCITGAVPLLLNFELYENLCE